MNITKEDIVATLKEFFGYEHSVFYYGNNVAAIKDALEKHHRFGTNKVKASPKTLVPAVAQGEVFFLPYDKPQVDVIMAFPQSKFNKEFKPYEMMYNQYFGEGLSSIVFQEMRESRSLAYSVQSSMMPPSHKDDYHYFINYIGTQADKLESAVSALNTLVEEMPYNASKFESAKQFLAKQMEATRYSGAAIFSYWLSMKDQGIETDIDKEYYQTLKNMTFADLAKFHKAHVKGKKMNYGIIGSKQYVDWKAVEKLGNGKVKELTTQDIFGY